MKMLSENISQIRQCYKLLDEIKERKDVEDAVGEQECESVRGGRQTCKRSKTEEGQERLHKEHIMLCYI